MWGSLGPKARAESAAEGATRKFWLICIEMLEKGPKFFAPSARLAGLVGVVVRPGQMGLRPEVIRYPKKGQFCNLGVVELGRSAATVACRSGSVPDTVVRGRFVGVRVVSGGKVSLLQRTDYGLTRYQN